MYADSLLPVFSFKLVHKMPPPQKGKTETVETSGGHTGNFYKDEMSMKMSKSTKYFNIQLKTNPVSQITKGYPIMNYLPLLII